VHSFSTRVQARFCREWSSKSWAKNQSSFLFSFAVCQVIHLSCLALIKCLFFFFFWLVFCFAFFWEWINSFKKSLLHDLMASSSWIGNIFSEWFFGLDKLVSVFLPVLVSLHVSVWLVLSALKCAYGCSSLLSCLTRSLFSWYGGDGVISQTDSKRFAGVTEWRWYR